MLCRCSQGWLLFSWDFEPGGAQQRAKNLSIAFRWPNWRRCSSTTTKMAVVTLIPLRRDSGKDLLTSFDHPGPCSDLFFFCLWRFVAISCHVALLTWGSRAAERLWAQAEDLPMILTGVGTWMPVRLMWLCLKGREQNAKKSWTSLKKPGN